MAARAGALTLTSTFAIEYEDREQLHRLAGLINTVAFERFQQARIIVQS